MMSAKLQRVENQVVGSMNATILFCPNCGKMIMNDCNPRIDDAGTKFFKCESCGLETSTPKKKTRRVDDEPEEHNDEEKQEHESQADLALKLVLSEDIELFYDQHKTPYVRISISGYEADATDATDATAESKRICTHQENIRLHSIIFKTYIAHLFYENEGKVIGQEAINSALNILHFKALQGKQYILYNRVAPDPSGDGSIWIDIADNQHRAYHVTKDGWNPTNNVPILFRTYEHQQPLPEAVPGGDPWLLLDYMNLGKSTLLVSGNPSNASVASTHSQKELLFTVHCASYFVPDIPHPISAMFGCKGTWKSSSQTFIRGIFDPSSVPLLRFPETKTH